MAKQKGIFRFTGTIDGLTYYDSKYGPLVRRKGGPTSKQIKTDPKFKRVRENASEFGSCSKATKLLRSVLNPLMHDASDFQVTGRLNKLMHAIKNLDNISERGERSVAVGMSFPTANDLAKDFDFNELAKMNRVLKKPYNVNTSTGVISITGLTPKKNLKYPANATHAKITGAWARIDFGSGLSELQITNQVRIPLDGSVHNIVLTPSSVPASSGSDIFVLQIVFLQEINGDTYVMKNGEFNSMAIIAVS